MEPRSRRTREELKALVLEAGREILLDKAPALSFEELNYSSVFSHLQQTRGVRVTHASVHERIWPNQQAFQIDVLKSALAETPEASAISLTGPLQEVWEAADLDTVDGRRHAAQELVRVAQNANWDSIVMGASPVRTYEMARLSVASFGPDTAADVRNEFVEFMQSLRDQIIAEYVELIRVLTNALGLRPRAELGLGDEALTAIVRASNAVSVGYLLDRRDHDRSFELPTGPDGELQHWRAVSLATWSLMRGWLEFADPHLSDPERWL